MTQETYMPSEGEMRRAYASHMTLNGVHAGSVAVHHLLSEGKLMDFNRWLAAHDARIRAEALTLSDDELSILEGAYSDEIERHEGDGIGSMSIALKAVAEHRKEQK